MPRPGGRRELANAPWSRGCAGLRHKIEVDTFRRNGHKNLVNLRGSSAPRRLTRFLRRSVRRCDTSGYGRRRNRLSRLSPKSRVRYFRIVRKRRAADLRSLIESSCGRAPITTAIFLALASALGLGAGFVLPNSDRGGWRPGSAPQSAFRPRRCSSGVPSRFT